MMPLFLDSVLSVAFYTCAYLTFVLNFNVLYTYGTQKAKNSLDQKNSLYISMCTYMPLHIASQCKVCVSI